MSTLSFFLSLGLGLAGQDAPPPAKLLSTEGIDPEVVAHIETLVAAVEADPGNGETHAELGLAYEANTFFAPAVQSYRNTVALLPDKAEWKYRLGVMLVADGELVEAEKMLTAAAAKLKNTPVIQARLGDARMNLGDLEGSEAAWQAALAAEATQPNNPKWPQSRVGLASVRYEQGRYSEAVTLCEEALGLYPTYRHAHYLLAMCLFEVGEDDRAEIELALGMKAWPEFPPDPHGPRIRGHARGFHHKMMSIENTMMAQNVVGARQMVEAVLVDHPDSPHALNILARCQEAMGQSAEALETLRKSEELDDDLVMTKIQLATSLLNLSSREVDQEKRVALIEEAKAKTQAAVEKAPRQGRVHYFHGLTSLAMGDGQTALQEMQIALRLGCDEPDLYNRLTLLSAQMGRMREMINFAKKNAADRPYDGAAVQLLVQAYLTDKRYDEAEAALAKLEALGIPQFGQFIGQVKQVIAQERAALEPQPGPPLDDQDK